MRLSPAFFAPLALAAVLVGCASNAVPLPAEDAQLPGAEQVRAARPTTQAEGEEEAAAPDAASTPAAEVAPEATPLTDALRKGVGRYTLEANYSFFLRGRMQVPGLPDVLIAVQTDHPDLCAHLGAGTMPRNATMLAVALMREDGTTLAERGSFVARGNSGDNTPLQASAYFRHLDGACVVTPMPDNEGAVAETGSAELLALHDNESAQVRYSFKMNTGDVIEGEMAATYCDAPKLFDDPMWLLNAEVDPKLCR